MQSSNDNRNIIFIIAGEASGDQIGADLIYQLKKLNKITILLEDGEVEIEIKELK